MCAFGQERYIGGLLLDVTRLPVVEAKITLRPYESHIARGEEERAIREGRPHRMAGLNPVEIAKTNAHARVGDIRIDGPKDWINPDYKGGLKLEQVIVDPRSWTGKRGDLQPVEVSDPAECFGLPVPRTNVWSGNHSDIPYPTSGSSSLLELSGLSAGPVNPDDLERV